MQKGPKKCHSHTDREKEVGIIVLPVGSQTVTAVHGAVDRRLRAHHKWKPRDKTVSKKRGEDFQREQNLREQRPM